MINITNLHKNFGDLEVLKNISTEIKKGEIISIIGPSGSGKSTFLNIVAGLLSADKGSLSLDGTNYMELPDEEKSEFRNKNIGFIPQSPALLSYLNVLEILDYLMICMKKMEIQKEKLDIS